MSVAMLDEPGGVIDGWVDASDDDGARCCCGDAGLCCDPSDTSKCGPEPGDPHGRKEYTLKAKGMTEVHLEFGDP